MGVEDAIAFVEQALFPEQLTKIQKLVFHHAWHGLSYLEIAKSSGYDPGYIKDTGSKLWQALSDAYGMKVTKHNFQGVLKQAIKRGMRYRVQGTENAFLLPIPYSLPPH